MVQISCVGDLYSHYCQTHNKVHFALHYNFVENLKELYVHLNSVLYEVQQDYIFLVQRMNY